MPGRVEDQPAAHHHRLALRVIALAGQLAAPDQRPDAFSISRRCENGFLI